jgi:hypothetical protein
MKMVVFWAVAPYNLIEIYRRFRGACDSIIKAISLTMEAASTSEMSVNFYQTIWRNSSEDSHFNVLFYSRIISICSKLNAVNCGVKDLRRDL